MKQKKVVVKRKKQNTILPPSLTEDSVMKIGPSFSDTGDITTGLSYDEKIKLMPGITGYPPTDVSFIMKTREFFANLEVSVPQAGLPLEVGIDEKTGLPYNLLDYIKYRFILANPTVAKDLKESQSSARFSYYIEDKELILQETHDSLTVKKDAYKEYIKLGSNDKKLSLVKRVLGISLLMDSKSADIKLEKIVTENPDKFLAIINDPDLETRAFMLDCLSKEVLRKVGNSLLDGEIVVGNSEEEAILYLKDKKNSEHLLILKSKLEAKN